MKKKLFNLVGIGVLALGLVGCSGAKQNADKKTSEANESTSVKIGLVGANHDVWDFVKSKLEKEGIKIEFVEFSDYNQPNVALVDKEIDLNSFQHQAFLDKFNQEKKANLVSIGDTVLAPLGIFSQKYDSVDQIPDKAQIAIPVDPTNQSRALVLLQSADLIKLDAKPGQLVTNKDIKENPKNLDIITVDASQTARNLQDVAASCINNGYAVDAGFDPVKDSIFLEPVDENSKPYINIIVARPEDKDNEIYKKIVKAYQADDTKKVIEETSKGASIPAWDGDLK